MNLRRFLAVRWPLRWLCSICYRRQIGALRADEGDALAPFAPIVSRPAHLHLPVHGVKVRGKSLYLVVELPHYVPDGLLDSYQ